MSLIHKWTIRTVLGLLLLLTTSLSAVSYVHYDFYGRFIPDYTGPTFSGPVSNEEGFDFRGSLAFALPDINETSRTYRTSDFDLELSVGLDAARDSELYTFSFGGELVFYLDSFALGVNGGDLGTKVGISLGLYVGPVTSSGTLRDALSNIHLFDGYNDLELSNEEGASGRFDASGVTPVYGLADGGLTFLSPTFSRTSRTVPDGKVGYSFLVPLGFILIAARRRFNQK